MQIKDYFTHEAAQTFEGLEIESEEFIRILQRVTNYGTLKLHELYCGESMYALPEPIQSRVLHHMLGPIQNERTINLPSGDYIFVVYNDEGMFGFGIGCPLASAIMGYYTTYDGK